MMTGQCEAWLLVCMMTGEGLHRSEEAGLRIPDDPRTLTGLGEADDEVVDMGEVTDEVEEAGLMGTVLGAYTLRLAGSRKAISPLGSLVGTS